MVGAEWDTLDYPASNDRTKIITIITKKNNT
jgi:hypothetical protein